MAVGSMVLPVKYLTTEFGGHFFNILSFCSQLFPFGNTLTATFIGD